MDPASDGMNQPGRPVGVDLPPQSALGRIRLMHLLGVGFTHPGGFSNPRLRLFESAFRPDIEPGAGASARYWSAKLRAAGKSTGVYSHTPCPSAVSVRSCTPEVGEVAVVDGLARRPASSRIHVVATPRRLGWLNTRWKIELLQRLGVLLGEAADDVEGRSSRRMMRSGSVRVAQSVVGRRRRLLSLEQPHPPLPYT